MGQRAIALRRLYSAPAGTPVSPSEKLWSDTATWGGSLPIANDAVVIPDDGFVYVLDTSTPILGSLTVNGQFKFSDTVSSVALYSKQISVEATGIWRIGSAAAPYDKSALIELSGARPTTSGNPGGGALVTGLTYNGNVATGNNGTTNDNQGVSRGIIWKAGSQRYWYGSTPAVTQCALGADVLATEHLIPLEVPVTWAAGTRILLTTSGFYNASRRTEVFTVASDVTNSTVVPVVEAVGYDRLGRLQYPTDAGMSFTPGAFTLYNAGADFTGVISGATLTASSVTRGTLAVGQIVRGDRVGQMSVIIALGTGTGGAGTYTLSVSQTVPSTLMTSGGMKAHASTPTVLDERAWVEVLTRPINVQGANDSAWSTNGFGVHDMVMGLTSKQVMKGTRYFRCGQRGLLGRYPWHFHTPSINPATGAFNTNPATSNSRYADGDAVIERCVVEDSQNRGISIHGCHGLKVLTNTFYKTKGHTLFLEDGSEMWNTIDGNGVHMVDDPGSGNRLLGHDQEPFGIWYSNPNNWFRNNRVSDCAYLDGFEGGGIINSFAAERGLFKSIAFTGTGTGTMGNRGTFEGITVPTRAGRAAGLQVTNQTWTFTAINSTTFSMVGSFSGSRGNHSVNTDYNDLPNMSGLTYRISTGGTAFVAGDQFVVQAVSCGGVTGLTQLAGTDAGAGIHPAYIPILEYSNNKSWGCRGRGVRTGGFPVDNEGTITTEDKISPTSDGLAVQAYSESGPALIFVGTKIHHCGESYKNRVSIADYIGWTVSSVEGAGFFGVTDYGSFGRQHLMVGKSLHAEQPGMTQGFASYHGSISFVDITAFNYPLGDFTFASETTGSVLEATSLMQTWDLYFGVVQKDLSANTNWTMWNVNAFWNTPPGSILSYYSDITGSTPASNLTSIARWDKNGQLGGVKNSYIGFNIPFFTAETTTTAVAAVPSGNSHAVYTTDRCLGYEPVMHDAGGTWKDDLYATGIQITWQRVDSSYADISSATWQTSATTGFRHVSCKSGARFRVFDPSNSTPSSNYRWVRCANYTRRLAHSDAVDDYQILGFPWANGVTAKVWSSVGLGGDGSPPSGGAITKPGSAKTYTAVGSRAALEGSAGRTFFQDTTNNMVWVKPLQHDDSVLDSVSALDPNGFYFDLVIQA